MTGTGPSPGYTLLRGLSLTIAALAVAMAITGVVAGASVLAGAVAIMALTTFVASYYL